VTVSLTQTLVHHKVDDSMDVAASSDEATIVTNVVVAPSEHAAPSSIAYPTPRTMPPFAQQPPSHGTGQLAPAPTYFMQPSLTGHEQGPPSSVPSPSVFPQNTATATHQSQVVCYSFMREMGRFQAGAQPPPEFAGVRSVDGHPLQEHSNELP
jgi:hypothetical protein